MLRPGVCVQRAQSPRLACAALAGGPARGRPDAGRRRWRRWRRARPRRRGNRCAPAGGGGVAQGAAARRRARRAGRRRAEQLLRAHAAPAARRRPPAGQASPPPLGPAVRRADARLAAVDEAAAAERVQGHAALYARRHVRAHVQGVALPRHRHRARPAPLCVRQPSGGARERRAQAALAAHAHRGLGRAHPQQGGRRPVRQGRGRRLPRRLLGRHPPV
mmetsp:Transcript_26605/g.89714  ORF Transcript_26605/g.89714 Transcript_26605/m.89714 type:complete len:219 (+) Transcript_26605:413-1069(+)